MPTTIDNERARFNMIEQQIRPWDVIDDTVLKLMAVVKREDFVAPAHRNMAFADVEIPVIVDGVDTGERMVSPKIEARLLQCLNVGPDDTALEIGAGSGHFAALLGTRARNVITLEINADIAALARSNLLRAGLQNVVVVEADGATGLEAARLAGKIDADLRADVIVISGSVPAIPAAYVDMLKPGGRLVAFVGEDPLSSAEVITRQQDGTLSQRTLLETRVPALHHAAVPSKFRF